MGFLTVAFCIYAAAFSHVYACINARSEDISESVLDISGAFSVVWFFYVKKGLITRF